MRLEFLIPWKREKKEWDQETLQFLRDNYESLTNHELAKITGLGLTTCRTLLYSMGLKRMELEYWTDEQVEMLKVCYPLVGDVEIADYFNALFPERKWTHKHIDKKRRDLLKLKRTPEQVEAIKKRNIELGAGTKSNFKRWEGRRGEEYQVRIWNRAGKEVPVIKINNKWRDLWRYNWEQEHGPIPDKYVVTLKDKSSNDWSVSNLECISWQEHFQKCFEKNDGWYAAVIARGDSNLKSALLENPEFLELYKLKSKLKKEIKNAVAGN
jgi:hypothetical protein